MTVSVPARSRTKLGRVEGDLEVGRGAVVSAEGDLIKVDGRVESEGDVVFEGNLEAQELRMSEGDLDVRGNLTIHRGLSVFGGDLAVSGSLSADELHVDRRLEVGRDTTVKELDVGSKAELRGNLKADLVQVGGALNVAGKAEVGDLEAGGAARIAKDITSRTIDVGGAVTVGGGKVTDSIDVGGAFESTGPLEFNDLDVGGSVRLSGDSVGKRVEVGGTVRVRGNFRFDELEVGGVAEIEGNGEGADVDVGGVLRVDGSLTLKGRLEVGGKCRVRQKLRADRIEISGWLEALEVEARDVEVERAIVTEKGVRAESIAIGDGGRVKGPLTGDRIRIGENAEVENLHGRDIELEERVRAGAIKANDLEVATDCRISGEVVYSGSLRVDEDVSFTSNPRKADSFPPFPDKPA